MDSTKHFAICVRNEGYHSTESEELGIAAVIVARRWSQAPPHEG